MFPQTSLISFTKSHVHWEKDWTKGNSTKYVRLCLKCTQNLPLSDVNYRFHVLLNKSQFVEIPRSTELNIIHDYEVFQPLELCLLLLGCKPSRSTVIGFETWNFEVSSRLWSSKASTNIMKGLVVQNLSKNIKQIIR